MNKLKALVLLGFCGFALAACGEEKAVEEKGTATKVEQIDTSSVSSSESSSESAEELDEGVEARNVFDTDWNEEWHQTTFKITEVSVVQYSLQEAIDLTDSEFMVGVNFEVKNDGDHTISAYPNQAIAVVSGKQYDADMLLSDNVGGDIVNGSMINGMVVFAVPDLKSVDDLKELRLTWPANDFNDTSNIEDTSKDFDVTLELKK